MYAWEYLCVDNKIFLKYDNLFVVIDILNREKFLRLTMGFGYFMYSHSLVPVIDLWFSGRDKVGIRVLIAVVELWCIVLCFLFTTAA